MVHLSMRTVVRRVERLLYMTTACETGRQGTGAKRDILDPKSDDVQA